MNQAISTSLPSPAFVPTSRIFSFGKTENLQHATNQCIGILSLFIYPREATPNRYVNRLVSIEVLVHLFLSLSSLPAMLLLFFSQMRFCFTSSGARFTFCWKN